MNSEIVLKLDQSPDNPRNSDGSFVALAGGRILFAYSRYYGKSWADEATARICARCSTDGGRTWPGTEEVIVENEGRKNIMSVSLLRLQDGRVGLWYLRKNSVMDCRTHMRTSRDEGRTWSRAALCIPAPGYFVVNNDRVIQLRNGRLVIPAAYHRAKLPVSRKPGNMYAGWETRGIVMFYLSDDGGRNWRESKDWWTLPVRSGSGLQEPGVVELADGRLYAFCRTDVGCQYEMFSDFMGISCLLAIWNDHSGRLMPMKSENIGWTSKSWGRIPLVSAISRDQGKTWGHHKLLESDPAHGFCYTAIHFMDDAVLLAYNCGGGERSVVIQDLCIRRVTLDWLYA